MLGLTTTSELLHPAVSVLQSSVTDIHPGTTAHPWVETAEEQCSDITLKLKSQTVKIHLM